MQGSGLTALEWGLVVAICIVWWAVGLAAGCLIWG